jgi:acetyltransferase-like isoleucine patch superfamily enzyme
MIRKLIRRLAMTHGRGESLYRRLGRPSGTEWAEYLRRHGRLYHLGTGCSILPSTTILDPEYTWIGDRVCLATCTLICHDGSIAVLYQRHGLRVDRIGSIVIGDDVYVGHGAMLLGGTRIGEGSIVGAGAVVRQSIPAGSVVTGNPARVVGRVEDVIRFWEAESAAYPWADLIARREGVYDAAMEPELRRLRQEYFFKDIDGRGGETRSIRGRKTE